MPDTLLQVFMLTFLSPAISLFQLFYRGIKITTQRQTNILFYHDFYYFNKQLYIFIRYFNDILSNPACNKMKYRIYTYMEELARCKSSLYSLRRVSMYGDIILFFQMFYSGVLIDVHQYIWRLEQYPECPTHGYEEEYIEEETVYHQCYVLPIVLNLKQS